MLVSTADVSLALVIRTLIDVRLFMLVLVAELIKYYFPGWVGVSTE